jgi:hypothetical protein
MLLYIPSDYFPQPQVLSFFDTVTRRYTHKWAEDNEWQVAIFFQCLLWYFFFFFGIGIGHR